MTGGVKRRSFALESSANPNNHIDAHGSLTKASNVLLFSWIRFSRSFSYSDSASSSFATTIRLSKTNSKVHLQNQPDDSKLRGSHHTNLPASTAGLQPRLRCSAKTFDSSRY